MTYRVEAFINLHWTHILTTTDADYAKATVSHFKAAKIRVRMERL